MKVTGRTCIIVEMKTLLVGSVSKWSLSARLVIPFLLLQAVALPCTADYWQLAAARGWYSPAPRCPHNSRQLSRIMADSVEQLTILPFKLRMRIPTIWTRACSSLGSLFRDKDCHLPSGPKQDTLLQL